ncbi:Ig kappa chain C region [Platysternon megacephalum]|uniref:Ig kappa chain C region n=1 Tax=Platysternon megacephalum TaxID=55544 RepID=A0A4D9EUG1_9SAUR|nr:Ig kappa chain C region [Platysternon megacephalum]
MREDSVLLATVQGILGSGRVDLEPWAAAGAAVCPSRRVLRSRPRSKQPQRQSLAPLMRQTCALDPAPSELWGGLSRCQRSLLCRQLSSSPRLRSLLPDPAGGVAVLNSPHEGPVYSGVQALTADRANCPSQRYPWDASPPFAACGA